VCKKAEIKQIMFDDSLNGCVLNGIRCTFCGRSCFVSALTCWETLNMYTFNFNFKIETNIFFVNILKSCCSKKGLFAMEKENSKKNDMTVEEYLKQVRIFFFF
jgi:hypothetical protein